MSADRMMCRVFVAILLVIWLASGTARASLTGECSDVDCDGICDADDVDSDNDGIPNSLENDLGIDPFEDLDMDGIANFMDADEQGDESNPGCADANVDGKCDVLTTVFDADGDGVANHLDVDSDNDGIPDSTEAGHGAARNIGETGPVDLDGDGLVDGPYGDNGFANTLELGDEGVAINYAPLDTDSDGVPDSRDLDSDQDGDFDISEVAALSAFDTDDGRIDASLDLDGDGLLDIVDADTSRFAFPKQIVDPISDDTDSDGIPNSYDLADEGPQAGDSDDDGVPDHIECIGGWPCPDSNQDGSPNYMTENDADGDLIADSADIDADNDGILDSDETLLVGRIDPDADADGDGVPNFVDANAEGNQTCTDLNSDEICDGLSNVYDLDNDGIPNHLDVDSDGDSIYDVYEAGHRGEDVNRDGHVDGSVGANGLADVLESSDDKTAVVVDEITDTDSDSIADFLDIDSDNDSIADVHEAGDAELETDPIDSDGDGEPDFRDLDSDGDGLVDRIEAGDDDVLTPPIDTDGDGLSDAQESDSDGDGFADDLGVAGGGCGVGAPVSTPWWILILVMTLVWKRKLSISILLALLLGASGVEAQTSVFESNYPIERFRLPLTKDGVLTVESGTVSKHLSFDLATWAGFSEDPLVIYRDRGQGRTRVGALVSHRFGSSVLMSFGLFDRIQIALDFPLVLSQDQELTAISTSNRHSSFGFGDASMLMKFQMLRAQTQGIDASLVLTVTLPTASSDDYFGEQNVSVAPRVGIVATVWDASSCGELWVPDTNEQPDCKSDR